MRSAFSWDAFDELTVRAFASETGFTGDPSRARDYLARTMARPTDDFVRTTKDTIARVWLVQHPQIAEWVSRQLFEKGVGPMGRRPTDAAGAAKYVTKCRNSSGLRKLLLRRLLNFGQGAEGDLSSGIPALSVVSPARQVPVPKEPYAFQKEAWGKLDQQTGKLGSTSSFRGLLVMPTGSGKTYTAVHWLTRRWLNSGKRILWIAHREELLAQAAREFVKLSYLAHSRQQLRIRQVVTGKSQFSQIDPADDVVCCSIQTLARAGSAAAELLQDENLFVVIDEAHHAAAKSYRELIKTVELARVTRLLGLTATPTRTAEGERPELRRLFGGNVVYQINAAELIASEILARPVPITVQTQVAAEEGMTSRDREHIVRFRELPPEMLARIGQNEERNRVIVQQYRGNEAKYGKTLVFTTDVVAAAQLTNTFRSAGVTAEYLASYRPDGTFGPETERELVLEKFASLDSGLDVLINVEILTEGVDLPATRTVFLARPTSSEILFRQMVGRALRGPRAGGNREAFLVSFEDHWNSYHEFLSPTDWLAVSGIQPPADEVIAAPTGGDQLPLSWDTVLGVAHAIRATLHDSEADVFEAVPHGMYVLDYLAAEEDVRRVIHVYEHQRPSWAAAFQYIEAQKASSLDPGEASFLDEEFFGDCEPPRPPMLDLSIILERARAGDPSPSYVPLQGREACDPRQLAVLAKTQDLRRSEENNLLGERYSPLARVIYPSMLDFRRAFDDALRELEHPGSAAVPKGVPVFDPLTLSVLRPGPHHNLQILMTGALTRAADILGQPVTHSGKITWSKRPIKGWFGKAWHDAEPGRGDIKINVLLDSPDFSEETLQFLLWHEYLHLYLLSGHTPEFRRLERTWPNYLACDREMDSLNEKFGVQYW